MVQQNITGPVDCACVIHGDGYTWDYVDKLYSMLARHITQGIRLHVYTEEHRTVPLPYIKHSLLDLGIGGPKQSWWYKMQLFNTEYHKGPLLYFDLDTVIVDNLDWIIKLPLGSLFWSVRDFKHLWRPANYSVNSSVMWWDTRQFDQVWRNFKIQELDQVRLKYRGDQDYIFDNLPRSACRFFDTDRVKSWRWQCTDGGYNFAEKRYLQPNLGTVIEYPTSILVFHGNPKPDKVADPVILRHWQ